MPHGDSAGPRVRFRDTSEDATEQVFMVERGRSDLRLEVSRSRRLRLLAGERRLMWAHLWSGRYGVTLIRNDDEISPGILPPFRASEARAHAERGWWMRRLAQLLADSPRSPLRSGMWRLSALQPAGDGSSRFVPVTEPREIELTVLELYSVLRAPIWREDDFGAHGSWSVWPSADPPSRTRHG